jgi:hypothetical protein
MWNVWQEVRERLSVLSVQLVLFVKMTLLFLYSAYNMKLEVYFAPASYVS